MVAGAILSLAGVVRCLGQEWHTPEVSATLFDIKDRGRAIYTFESEYDGNRRRSWFYDLDGVVVAEDEAEVDREGLFRRYAYTRQTIEERAEAVRDGDEVVFRQHWKGEVHERREPWSDFFAAGPTVVPWMRGRWDALLAGKTLEIRFGVLDQVRSFGFKLKRDHDRSWNFRTVIVMRASSFLLRIFIDPIEFHFDTASGRLLAIEGRSLPVRQEGDKLSPVNAVIDFTRPAIPR